MKIAIGTIFYNSYNELNRLEDSIPKGVIDYWIKIDGVFKYTKERNPKLTDNSNDGSEMIRINLEKEIPTCHMSLANKTEFDKRNKYLELCESLGMDVLIIVDSDEYFVYPEGTDPLKAWNTFKKNLEFEMRRYPGHNVFGIPTWDVETNTRSYCPRIWVNPSEMRYLNNSHYHYGNIIREAKEIETFRQNNLNFIQQAQAIVKGITLAHSHDLRTPDQMKLRLDYQRYLVKFESLVQSHKYSSEEAHDIAKKHPDNNFSPT